MKLDISNAPSAMEETARAWGSTVTPPPVPRPRSLPAAPTRRKARPFPDSADHGGPGFFGGNPGADGIRQAAEAKADAMRAMARGVPDPAHYARYMPAKEARELQAAQWHGCWRFRPDISPALLSTLRAVGLAYTDVRHMELTHFACAVRRELMADDQ